MCAGEECSDCHHCKLAALWGRTGGMIGQLWNESSYGELGQCWISDKSKCEWNICLEGLRKATKTNWVNYIYN